MSDRYMDFVNSSIGQSIARSLGFPQPVKLRRMSTVLILSMAIA